MKIIYITNTRIPTEKAHGVQTMKMCEAFVKQGASVELVLPKRFNYIKADPFKYHDVENIFKITKIPCLDLIILGKFGFFLQEISFSLSAVIFSFFKKYDALFTRDAIFCLFGRKENLFLEIHGFSKMPRFFLLWIFRRCRGIVSTTTYKAKTLVSNFGINNNKILFFPNGVDLGKFKNDLIVSAARQELNLPLSKKIIMYVGGLYIWKGVDTIINAAENFIDDNVEFIIVGGVEKEILKYKKIIKFKEIKNIKLLGHQNYELMVKYMTSADILLLPNIPISEESKLYTSPIKLFEYMASSRPIIASDLPSIREVANENNCLFFQPGNATDLVEKIKKILEDPILAQSLAQQARRDVEKYSWEKRANKILEFIKSSRP